MLIPLKVFDTVPLPLTKLIPSFQILFLTLVFLFLLSGVSLYFFSELNGHYYHLIPTSYYLQLKYLLHLDIWIFFCNSIFHPLMTEWVDKVLNAYQYIGVNYIGDLGY